MSLKTAAAQFPKLMVVLGKLVRRQRLPKNDVGDFWSWKDLNVAMNLPCYGRVFRIYDCDRWTRVSVVACLSIILIISVIVVISGHGVSRIKASMDYYSHRFL